MIFKKYLAFKCNKCKKWTGKEQHKWRHDMTEQEKENRIKAIMCNCTRCEYKTKFKHAAGINVQHYWFDMPAEMTRYIQEANKIKDFKKTENNQL